jgi:membrane-bound ClpP family serine protease
MRNPRLIMAIITSLLDEALIIAVILWGLPRLGINLPIWGTVLASIIFAVYAVTVFRVGSRILAKKPVPGLTDMVGLEGTVIKSLNPRGLIKIEGEIWEARSEKEEIKKGTAVVVTAQERLKLVVRKIGI